MAVAKKYVESKRKTFELMMAENKKKGLDSENVNVERFNILSTLYEVREIFPNVYNLYASIDTFGCSTAICDAKHHSQPYPKSISQLVCR